jgi:protease-4
MGATGKIPLQKTDADAGQAKTPGKKKKSHHSPESIPVFVSQGNVAASGGYYLSAVADKIFATPMSITGSIGVVGGKFNVQPLMKKLGISVDRAPKKNSSPAFSAFSDFDNEQKKAIGMNMHEVYAQFLRDVAQGRKTEVGKIKPHASGRVFSGLRAQTLGLTDREGGIGAALEALKNELGIRPHEAFNLTVLPNVKESLFNRSFLPFGLARLMALADFAKPGVYALDLRFWRI